MHSAERRPSRTHGNGSNDRTRGWMRFGGYAAPYGYPAQYQQPDSEIEKQMLENQAEALQSELDLIKKRLGEIGIGTAVE